jgi:hypothetical protein
MQLSKKQFNTLPLKQRQALMVQGSAPRRNQKARIPRGLKSANGGTGIGGRSSSLMRQSRQGNNVIAAAASYSSVKTSKAPLVTASREQCRIVHRELIGSVTGSVAFAIAFNLALNPGINTTFPWLSGMASLWEEYQFSKLRFCYETRTGTATPGSVLQAIDYDAADAAPTSEQIISSYQGAVEGAPWITSICCDARGSSLSGFAKRRYLRTGALANNQDIKTYDVGNYFLATVDGTAVGWGKLYVEYDVTFFIPQLPSAGPLPLGGSFTAGGTMSAANPLGDAPVSDAGNLGITVSAASVVTFLRTGTYLVCLRSVGTTLTAIPNPTLVNCTLLGNTQGANGTTVCMACITLTVDADGGTAAFTATAGTITSGVMRIGMAPTGSLA